MSEIRATTISNLAGTGPATLTGQSAAKAWVNFNGTGTVAIRDSFNVSSLTDNGTGDYTANWSSAFDAGNYAISGAPTGSVLGGSGSAATFASPHNAAPTASSLRSLTYVSNTGAAFDSSQLALSIHGDLA